MSVKFKGCWHCGKEGHSRTPNARLKLAGCPEFAALKDKNGGKPPADYKGAYEKAIDAARAKAGKPPVVRRVLALFDDGTNELDDWEESDIESSDGIFALGATLPRVTPDFTHRNSFEDLDDGDEVDDVVGALSSWASTTVGSRKRQNKKPKTARNQISSVEDLEKAIKANPRFGTVPASTKKLNRALRRPLAEINLENDEILALIDTGATVHAADSEVHFKDYVDQVRPTPSSRRGDGAVTAGGHLLPNKGKFTVHAIADGQDVSIPFNDMKVQMPILAVKKMMKKGTKMLLEEDGGVLYNSRTQQRLNFIEHSGLWFMKLKVKPPPGSRDADESLGDQPMDFHRRG